MSEAEHRPPRDIVVVGASAGGVAALLALCRSLPAKFPAALLVVQHIGANPSMLPGLLTTQGNNPAVHARQGQAIQSGTIYIAPPDHHMLVEDGRIRLTRDAKENYTRPAVDPLFRSAALAYGPRVIGVVLTGRLDDGTAGLQAIKDAGGLAVVQDPADAEHEGMPQSALRAVPVDRCVPLSALAHTLVQLLDEPVRESDVGDARALEQIALELQVGRGAGNSIATLNTLGTRSEFPCPECNGVLWQMNDSRFRRFRCHTGHAYSPQSLQHAQRVGTEEAIWNAIRALQGRECLLRTLAGDSMRSDHRPESERLLAEADKAARDARVLRDMLPHVEDDGADAQPPSS